MQLRESPSGCRHPRSHHRAQPLARPLGVCQAEQEVLGRSFAATPPKMQICECQCKRVSGRLGLRRLSVTLNGTHRGLRPHNKGRNIASEGIRYTSSGQPQSKACMIMLWQVRQASELHEQGVPRRPAPGISTCKPVHGPLPAQLMHLYPIRAPDPTKI